MEPFGDRVQSLRKAHDMSQSELAEHIGVSQSNISAYESGKQEPKMSQLILLARTFGVSIDYVCGLTETEH